MGKSAKLKTDLGDSSDPIFSDEVIKITKAIDINVASFYRFTCGYCHGQIPKLLPNTKYKLVSFAMGTDNNLTYSDEVVITTLK